MRAIGYSAQEHPENRLRFPLLAIATAAIAVSSSQLQGQNSVQPPLDAANTPLPEMTGGRGESVTIGDSDRPYAQAGLYSILEVTPPAQRAASSLAAASSVTSTSVNIDWRSKGAVTPVENAGQCGSDWAFSAKDAVQAEHFLATGTLKNLSAQQLIDCGGSTGSQGCNGGVPEQGMLYIQKMGSAALNVDYPYTARDGNCRRTAIVPIKISRIERSPVGDDVALLSMLETRGPVAVRVEDNWISGYRGENLSCASREHSLLSALLVGAITRNGEPVWVLKFSLGTAWGASGYAYLSRLRPNECGISEDAIVPVL
jgi:cathepsin L